MDSTSNNSIEAFTVDQITDIANKVVMRYVYRSVVPSREKDDVVMAIIEKFLNKRKKIEQAYKGNSKISTYFVAILNRMCCEIIRKESKHWYSIIDGELDDWQSKSSTLPIESEKRFAIANEVKRLSTTMLFFNGEGAKVNLFLKCFFDLPYSDEDIVAYASSKNEEVKAILENSGSTLKSDLFERLSYTVNLVEGKDIKGDAVRMWLNKQVDAILTRLNRNGASNHSKESLAVLFEFKCSQN